MAKITHQLMARWLGNVVLALLFLLSANQANAANRTITLFLNKGKVVKVYPHAKTVFVANPAIADFHYKTPGVIFLFSKKIGSTSLIAIDKRGRQVANYTIRVIPELSSMRREIQTLFPKQNIRIYSVRDTVALAGTVPSAKIASDIVRVIQRYVPEKDDIINMLKIGLPTEVNLRVRVVEMNRETTREIGLNWNAIYGPESARFGIGSSFPINQFSPSGGARNFFLTADVSHGNFDLTATIDLLDQQNLITILSEPNLTAKSGETAHFLVGGEFPIIVPQGGALNVSNTVEFKDFGVQLAFTPTLLSDRLINLHVRPEVSQLSERGAVEISGNRIPSLVTRRADTTVELRSGQSFVIAGLLESNSAHLLSRFPGLGNVPILGRLFTSEEFLRGETELVIIVTPYIVNPIAGEPLSVPTDEMPVAQTIVHKLKYGGYLGFILE